MTPCPTNDTLGAHVQHALDPDTRTRVQEHLDDCPACREVVLAAVRGAHTQRLARGTAAPPPSLIPGERVGRYEVRGLLGVGGMGRVYEAYDAELDRAIALKVLRPELAAGPLAERLVRESRMMAKLAHPAVITVYDAGVDGNAVFIAMELIRGTTLGAHLVRTKPGWGVVVALYEQAAAGLAAAHARGIVHRDVKPDNVLVETATGRVLVTDFGISRLHAAAPDPRDDVQLTAPGFAVGTPAYMAPEQLAGGRVDARADVFALCVSMWEALFGARPYPGTTVDDIRRAQTRRLELPTTRVPRWLVRRLMRGLSIDPAKRHADAGELLADLRGARVRRRRIAIGVAGALALGATASIALAVARPASVDPCAAGGEAIARAYAPPRAALLHARLPAEDAARLDRAAVALADTHAQTCHADAEPAQALPTATCLDARRVELDGVADDLITDAGRDAHELVPVVGDPHACASPAPGLLSARVPTDREERRAVTALRHQLFGVEAARNRGDFASAIAIATAAAQVKVWAPAHAEALYELGATQSQGGDNVQGIATLRAAAAEAEAAHADYIAANAWIQLVTAATFDDGDAERGLEYVTYAKAALDRIGSPPEVELMLDYAHGTALVEAGRDRDAEAVLRRAIDLARAHAPEYLPQALQGLGYLYENDGRYADAVASYRDAIAKLATTSRDPVSSAVNFRERLAVNLSLLGETGEAEGVAREAIAIADARFAPGNQDRAVAHATLAQVLEDAGRKDDALVEAHIASVGMAQLAGERNERYGEALEVEGTILADLDRDAEAAAMLARACEIIAYKTGDDSAKEAGCWMQEAIPLSALGKNREALALIDRVVPTMIKAFGEVHPQVANALVTRGALHAELGDMTQAADDLERAVIAFRKLPLDPGHLGGAEYALARVLWATDHARGKALVEDAIATLDHASGTWAGTRAEAAAWLASDGHLGNK